MTIACTWPRETFATYNPYLYLLHSALARNGVTFKGGLEIDNHWLRDRSGQLDALLIHWGVDHFWLGRGRGRLQIARSLAGLWRYFRLASKLGVRVVWFVHDIQPHERWTLADRAGFRILASAADVCVLHSEAGRQAFIERYPRAAAKTIVFSIGNYDGFYPAPSNDPRERFGLASNSRVLLCPGLLRPYKGYETAIDAMASLSSEYTLVIAGPPSVPSYVDELRMRVGDRANIRLLPKILDDQEYADIHAASDCVVLPYHKITGSSALLAAISMGRGVVVSDLPYFREMLAVNPQAGVLCDPGDPRSLAKGVLEYFQCNLNSRAIAARALADQFPWDVCVRPLVEYFRRAERRPNTPNQE